MGSAWTGGFEGVRRSAPLRQADRVRAGIFYRLAARFTPAIVVESHGLRYLMNTDDHGAGMTLFMGIDSDHQTLDRVLGALRAAGVAGPEGRTLIDVGANIRDHQRDRAWRIRIQASGLL